MKLAALIALLAALVTPQAAEAAKPKPPRTATLKGEVVGQPWRVGTKTLLPVLLSAKSAKRAGLQSPVGVLALKAKSVAVPRGPRIQPTLLRLADRVTTRVRVRRAQRRSPYWRIAARKLSVKKRSGTPSAAELHTLLTQLRANLAALSKGVSGLAGYTKQGFANLAGDLAALRAEIDAMKTQLAGLRADLAIAGGDVGEMRAAVDGLAGELGALSAGLETVSGDLTELTTTVEQLSDTVGALGGGLLGG